MPRWKKDKVKTQTEYMREWLQSEAGKEYQERHKEYAKEWRKKNKAKFNQTQQKNYVQLKIDVLTHYSGGIPKCKCCGERGIPFLTIDHINGDGAKHRREIDPEKKMGGNGFYYWLKKNNYPPGFQILCANCNFAKRNFDSCPHTILRSNLFDDYSI